MGHGAASVDLDTSIGYLLKQASSALRAAMEEALGPLGLTVTQYSTLEQLAQRPGRSASALARGTFVTRQSMQVVLQGLQEAGLVVRADIAPAGRALPTALTALGAERLGAASAAVRAVEDRMLGAVDDTEAAGLAALLRRCIAGLGG